MVWTHGKDGRKRLPHAALHGHVRGERSRGRQRKRWMNNVRKDLKREPYNYLRHMEKLRIEKCGEIYYGHHRHQADGREERRRRQG